jgi:hypothetical protein
MSYDFPFSSDELFGSDFPDQYNNAWLKTHHEEFYPYADGYRQGADSLIRQCIDEHGIKDILIFPVVFLYRQYVELRLKELIIGLHYCIDGSDVFPTHHRIDSLWGEFVSLYEELGENPKTKNFENAKGVIMQFSKIDPKSMAFRYPVTPNGDKTLSITHINVRNFGEVMERLANFLDAVSDQIAHYKDISSDMYNDW